MELWDVYDERRRKKPYAHERGIPLRDGDWHLVVEVWTFTSEGKLLLTLRHPDKHYGGLWECTGGSALRGEDSVTAVRRELAEETGLIMGDAEPTLLCTTLHHHAIVDTYAIRLPFTLADIRFQEGETVDAKLIDPSELNHASADWLPQPICDRLKTALPLLHRFHAGDELADMYDLEGRRLGYNRLRMREGQPPLFPDEMNLASILFLVDADNNILLTQRAQGKTAPGEWECTGGCVRAGESAEQAIVREAQEEIGLRIPQPRLLARIPQFSLTGHWRMEVFGCKMNFRLCDLRLQREEVSDARLAALSELSSFPLIRHSILERDPAVLDELRALMAEL